MNACAYTKGNLDDPRVAFRLTQSCLKQVLSNSRSENDDDRHNHIVFRTVFHACANLVPPGQKRNELVTSVFEECRRRGMVDMKVVLNLCCKFSNNMLNGNSKSILAKHLAHGRIEFQGLPLDSRSNVTFYGKRQIR